MRASAESIALSSYVEIGGVGNVRETTTKDERKWETDERRGSAQKSRRGGWEEEGTGRSIGHPDCIEGRTTKQARQTVAGRRMLRTQQRTDIILFYHYTH